MQRISAAIQRRGTGWHRLLSARGLLLSFALSYAWAPTTALADAFDDHVQQGQLLVIQGKLAEAAKEFEAAYKLKKQPDIALQLGRVYLKLRRGAAAQHYCALYLAEEFDAPADRKQKATECLEQAKQLVGRGKSSPSTPAASAGAVGQSLAPAAIRPTSSLTVSAAIASSTQVSARGPDWSPPSEVLEVPQDEPPAPPVGVTPPPPPPPPIIARYEGPQPVYKKWWFWTLVGVGVAGAAAGVAIGVSQSSGAPAPVPDPLDGIPMGDRRQIAF